MPWVTARTDQAPCPTARCLRNALRAALQISSASSKPVRVECRSAAPHEADNLVSRRKDSAIACQYASRTWKHSGHSIDSLGIIKPLLFECTVFEASRAIHLGILAVVCLVAARAQLLNRDRPSPQCPRMRGIPGRVTYSLSKTHGVTRENGVGLVRREIEGLANKEFMMAPQVHQPISTTVWKSCGASVMPHVFRRS